MDSPALAEEALRPSSPRRTVVRGLVQVGITIAVSTIAALIIISFYGSLDTLGPWNYLSAFLIEVASSATIILPTPGQAYVFLIAATLNPLVLGIVGGLGAALGELTGYAIGRGGHHIAQGGRFYGRFEGMMSRWGGPLLFGFAILPVPFDFAGVWAGTVRYPLWRFLTFVTPGKIIKVTVIALAGYYSAPWLLRLVGWPFH